MEDSLLILPGDPEFDLSLATALPPNWQSVAGQHSGDYGFVADSQTGILRIENSRGIAEYVRGGEYDERLDCFEEEDEEDGFYWL